MNDLSDIEPDGTDIRYCSLCKRKTKWITHIFEGYDNLGIICTEHEQSV